MSRKKSSVNYVNNQELLEAMIEYRTAWLKAKKEKKDPPRVPEYVGLCIYNIATRFATQHSYSNYPFKEDMISDGIENCIQYIHNFDPEKSKNPFAYFTQIIYYAFLRRIQKEKKYLYTKYALTQRAQILDEVSDNQYNDDSGQKGSIQQSDWSAEQMGRFMSDFETNTKKKATKKKVKKVKE
jgi:DNA-directed RNA polymerase specialized sigma subunit